MSRDLTLRLLLALPVALVGASGCTEELMLFDAGRLGGGLGGAKEGEPWTIRCLELRGTDSQTQAESVAESLRQTAGIKADAVRVEQAGGASTIYYGTYYRKMDRKTKHLVVTKEMSKDMRLIKELGVPGRGHYFNQAKFVPMPSADVGNPEWALARANGVYSLRIGVFYNEPGFYERKDAAAEYVKALREKGHSAFYRHGLINSEVFVGEFGADAVKPFQSRGGGGMIVMDTVSDEVRALQAKENFRYELWNLRRRVENIGGKQVAAGSQLMPIRETAEEATW